MVHLAPTSQATTDEGADTGARWRGPIGEGTVTFRLPYDVNATNTALSPDSMWDTGIKPPDFVVAGHDVTWRFEDLEPTAADNVRLTVLTPRVWRELELARASAEASPESAAAQADLGRALSAALYTNKDIGVVEIADSVDVARQAEAAFRRARALEPDDVGILLDDLHYLQGAYSFYSYDEATRNGSVTYLGAYPLFAGPGGGHAADLPVFGSVRPIHTPDGIRLNMIRSRRLAPAILVQLNRVAGTTLATPTPTQ